MPMQPIGTVYTPFTSLENMPIQPGGASEVEGRIEIAADLTRGLSDLDGFSHIYLIYLFHKAARTELSVIPFMDNQQRGVFATRSPLRPNHIGLSLVELISVKENIILIKGADVLDGTPLLDIKPFIPAFDQADKARSGWMQKSAKEVRDKRSDKRFL